jgi:hypothetical protein
MLLSIDGVLNEVSYAQAHNIDIIDLLENVNSIIESEIDTDEDYNKVVEHLKLDILDVERFVKVNNCQAVTSPRAFVRDSIPSDDGLLSNKIFGITKDERAGIFAYIDLHGYFMDPSCYKTLIRLDSKYRNVVHGIGTYRINDLGELVEDENGKTGIEWLRKNIKNIKFKSSDSVRRDIKVQYLNQNIDRMFQNKYIVTPPFYRDKNTSGSSRVVGLGGVNKLYNDLIVASNALTATQDYMFDVSDSMKGRVQELILNIYDWYCGNSNANITVEQGAGLSGKFGVLRRANMSKTANFSSRLVISSPELKVERPENMMVDFDHSALPLSAALAEFRDYIMFNVKRFFENEFSPETYPIMDANGKVTYIVPEDPEINFSDERIKHEMERYLHGYNNRFVPIEVPIEGSDQKFYMQFKGRGVDPAKGTENPESIFQRPLTWCDVFFIAAVESTKDKQLLITRFPIFLMKTIWFEKRTVAMASNNH